MSGTIRPMPASDKPTPRSEAVPLDHARLVDGARELGLDLPEETLASFDRYVALLRSWNERMNLVSRGSLATVESRHILDSLTALLAFEGAPTGSVIDVGSGAGFPGLPLKIVYPQIDLTLLEGTGKKVRFLEAAIKELGLEGVDAVSERAETLGRDREYREAFHVVLARGLAPLAVLAELTLPFCRQRGIVVAHKSPGVESEVEEARRAIEMLGGAPPRIVAVPEAITGEARVLVVIEKHGRTPQKYPRRPGLPANQPLRAL